jgi:heme exporter protein C
VNNRSQSQRFPLWGILYLALTFAVLAIGFFEAMTAPKEATMGNLYRVFFYHFPHTILSFVFPYMNCAAAFLYLYWRRRNAQRALAADAFALASAEVTVLYASVGLATGILWGRAAWGIWWTWDARLTTAFLLWLLYIAYLLLRGLLEDPERRATLSAVFGIFAFLDAPLVYASNRLWRTQHPAPVIFGGDNSGLDPTMGKVLVVCIFALLPVMILLLVDRYRLERMRHEVEELRLAAEAQAADANSVVTRSTA